MSRRSWRAQIDLDVTSSGGAKPCRVCKTPTAGMARMELLFLPLCQEHRTEEVVIRLFTREMRRRT